MAYGLVQTVAPTAEPTLTEHAKRYGRIDVSADDAMIAQLVAASRERCERVSGRQLITATWKLTLDSWWEEPWCFRDCQLGWVVQLPHPPLLTIVSVKYASPADGVMTTLAADQYQVDTRTVIGRLAPAYGATWPTPRSNTAGAVEIVYTAGYGADESYVPAEIKRALWTAVKHVFDCPDAVDEDFLDRLFIRFQCGVL